MLKEVDEEDMILKKHSKIVNESTEKEIQTIETTIHNNLPKDQIAPKGLSKDNIIGDINKGVSTRCKLNLCAYVAFVWQVEPKNVNDALNESNWIIAMQDELNQFTRNDVCSLVSKSDDMNIIGTKWVFINKMDVNGNIVTNKARLVAKMYNQEEGINFDETYMHYG